MLVSRPKTKLPQLEPYNPFESTNQPIKAEDQRLDELLQRMVAYLSTCFTKWKVDAQFQFELPDSQFDHKRDKPIITYLQPEAVQDEGMVGPLSAEQLNGIKTVGVFTVNSRRFAIPYKWRISEWLQRGSEHIKTDLYDWLGVVFSRMYDLKNQLNVKVQLGWIWQNIRSIAMLYVGLKSVNEHSNAQSIMLELEKRRQKGAFAKYTDRIDLALVEYIDVPIELEGEARKKRLELVQQRLQQLSRLSPDFFALWNSEKFRIVDQLEDTCPSGRLKQEVERIQHEMFVKMVRERPELDDKVKRSLLELVDNYNIISEIFNEKSIRTSEGSANINAQITRDFPIRSKCWPWRNALYIKFNNELVKREDEWMFDQLKRRIPLPYFEDYVRFCEQYDELYKQMDAALGTSTSPTGRFTFSYNLFPPYALDYNPTYATYSIHTSQKKTVSTDHNFWKLTLLWVRLLYGFRAIFYFLVRNMWVGSLGVRVLIERRKFYPEYIVNPTTGQVGRSPHHQRIPIYFSICSNLRRIARSRQKFESAPNSGLFDKRTARVFNLLYCYLYVLLLRVVVFNCILKPLFVLLNVAISIVLLIGMPVWLPLVQLFLYSLDIHIFNFNHQNSEYNYDRVNWFPLLRYVLRSIFTVLLIILKLTVVPLVLLLVSGVVLLWSYGKYVLRTSYDAIMLQLIKAIGRSPVTDSAMAWKIQGPGLTGSYYQSIKSTDIYLLVAADLEKIQMQAFQAEVNNLLQKPQSDGESINALVRDRLKGASLQLYKINESINYYTQRLYKQVRERTSVFPSSPGSNIRFTTEEMESFTRITKEIAGRFQSEHPEVDLYKQLNIRKRNENKLVKLIWQRIFQNTGVFQSLGESEMRFDAVKEEQEDDMAGSLADRIKAGLSNSEKKEGMSPSMFAALDEEDTLLAIYPKDCQSVSQAISLANQCTNSNLPSSKHQIYLSILLNPNVPQMK